MLASAVQLLITTLEKQSASLISATFNAKTA
jgi:hypothetical protein